VNPSNVVINPATGALKLIDFGIATALSRESPGVREPELLEGTLAYISPEQTGRMNRGVDHRSDLYSLGATLFELFTGRPPFTTADPAELVHSHIARTPPSPRDLNPAVPEVLAAIVLRLLAKDADERYQSAHAVARDLARCAAALRLGDEVEDFPLSHADTAGRFCLPQRLYGRERERDGLVEDFRAAADGPPRLTLVGGFSGVGKSALVREVQRAVAERRGYFLDGKGDELQRAAPYYALGQAMRALVEALLSEGEGRLVEWRARVTDAVGGLGGVLTPMVPNLELLLGPLAEPPRVTDEEARNRFLHLARSFVRAVCRPEHPVVLFLDDLQWVDGATFKLIEQLVADRATAGLLVVGAYRDNEVDPAHPVFGMAERLERDGAAVRRVTVEGLAAPDLQRLLADALGAAAGEVSALGALVFEKTQGNPFAVGEVLRVLHERRALAYHPGARRWTWDVAAIEALGLPSNVVELLAERMRRLGDATRTALQFAACVGNRFDLETLAVLCGRDPAAVAADLMPAIDQGLLVPLEDARAVVGAASGDRDFARAGLRFAHDRVQQSAYSLLDPEARVAAHHRLGRLLVERTRPEDLDDRIFDVVNQLDVAIERVTDPAERDALRGYNLRAAKASMRSAAFGQAAQYLVVARGLLPPDAWRREYAAALEIHSSLAEASFMNGDHAGVDEAARAVVAHARTALDRVRADESRLKAAAARDSLEDVVKIGLAALAGHGVVFPAAPTMGHVALALGQAKLALVGRSVEGLAHAPAMTDPSMVAALYLMERMSPAAFRTGSKLFPLLILRIVLLSVRHGCLPVSSFGYGGYALTLCGVLGDLDGGYRFGQMTLRLADRFGDDRYRGSARSVFEMFVRHWKEPLSRSFAPLVEASELGLATGRLFEAASAASYLAQWMFAAGAALPVVDAELDRYAELVRRDDGAHHLARLLRQVTANLRGADAQPWRLRGPHYDEAVEGERLARTPDKSELAFLHTYRLQLATMFGRVDEALACAVEAERHLEALTSMPLDPVLRFNAALARLAAHRRSPRAALLGPARKVAAQLRKWAAHSPANYEHKRLLLEAEVARSTGDAAGARDLYERAIAAARASGFAHEEALALELAGAFHLETGAGVVGAMLAREAEAAWRR
ncbi:MAG: Sensor protein, partial [Myxococcaceae bacterium]|nr:Sensor protein [Myxococcaceae bacterium]